nr:hypothetical protein [Tanacetum cinerariifolium]
MEDSFAGERNHHMVHKMKVIGQRIRVLGLNVLKESSKKHGIRESHFTTLGHTYHSMRNVVGKIEGLLIDEAVKHITQACVGMIYVSTEAYDIFTNNGFLFFAHSFHFGANHLEWIEGDIDTFDFSKLGSVLSWNNASLITDGSLKDDTTFMEEVSHERHVDLPFMTGEAFSTVIHGDVVCSVAMINLKGIRHNAPKGPGCRFELGKVGRGRGVDERVVESSSSGGKVG